ncbi:MAG: glycosyltransferase family 2 protein [Bacteroidales bacterium]|nr:glycosyltransferase family 2 protein [Bacteroidales bacterium]
MTFISIICPIYNEASHINACVNSVVQCDYPKESLELLLVDGMSDDGTREIIAQLEKEYSFIKHIDNPQRIVPYALNYAIGASKGEVIIRIDAHATYPKNYFSRLVEKLYALNADNVGGVWRTLPADQSATAEAIAAAMSCPFGMGNAQYRLGATKEMAVDTVPYGCFKREIFDRLGLFDTDLTRDQDDEVNGRIIKNGGKIFLLPDLVIDYKARPNIAKTCLMFFQYGLFKPLVNKKLGKPATLRQFFPPLFVSGLVLGAVLSFFSSAILYLYLTIIAIYLLLDIYFSMKNGTSIRSKFILIFVFFAIHSSYGAGYLVGLYKLLTHSKFEVKSSR